MMMMSIENSALWCAKIRIFGNRRRIFMFVNFGEKTRVANDSTICLPSNSGVSIALQRRIKVLRFGLKFIWRFASPKNIYMDIICVVCNCLFSLSNERNIVIWSLVVRLWNIIHCTYDCLTIVKLVLSWEHGRDSRTMISFATTLSVYIISWKTTL